MKTYSLYLNGKLESDAATASVRNPATGEHFAQIPQITRERARQAITDAHKAFAQWRRLPGKARGEWLQKIAARVEERHDELATLITNENGKPITQSKAEVTMTCDHLRWFAEEAKRGYGRVTPNWVENKRHLIIKTPMGVVGAISPWNFPLVLGIRKVAPALAAGCTVILKPARQTPLSSSVFAECVHAAGLPPGVFQLILGKADEIGGEFLQNPLCRKISFTGSTEVGQKLIRGAAEWVKPLSLELGGQAPCIVFEDADLSAAVEGAAIAKFRNIGQSCIAANRIYVHRSIYKVFQEAFVVRTKSMKVGNGLDPDVQIGPLIDEEALKKAEEHVADAVTRGGRLLCGGKRVSGQPGSFFEPAVLADVPDDALCSREETFAPIAPLYPFDTEEEVLARANSSKYGLSAYAFTRDISRMFRVIENLEAGIIGINDGVPTATQAPFGGVKMSGWGRELGMEGMDAFLDTKHVSINVL